LAFAWETFPDGLLLTAFFDVDVVVVERTGTVVVGGTVVVVVVGKTIDSMDSAVPD
jgi:hypothetical protein